MAVEAGQSTADGAPRGRHPYADLGPERSWRRAVAGTPPFLLDPASHADFRLTRSERIATAGSCFAQHVARVLRKGGYDVLDTEPLAGAADDGYSARYGNIYTTRQLAQLVARAYGRFEPRLGAWQREDGRFVDPFRPTVLPAGYDTPADVAAAREAHLGCVRRLLETLDTLVFTMGLTEGWRTAEDGAALPLPPGVAGGVWDGVSVAFANARVEEMVDDMVGVIDDIRRVNDGARMILTVSPVPLAKTFRERHVLVANASSKAALRVVADEVCARRPGVFYFPSYEIVTAPPTIGRSFADDFRTVTPEAVEHVMRCFLAHAESHGDAAPSFEVGREGALSAQVVCDEELLDA